MVETGDFVKSEDRKTFLNEGLSKLGGDSFQPHAKPIDNPYLY